MDEVLEKIIPLEKPGFNATVSRILSQDLSSDCDKDEANFSKIDNLSRELLDESKQASSLWEVERKQSAGDLDNGNLVTTKNDASKEKNSLHKGNLYQMDVEQCEVNAKNGHSKLSRFKKHSDKENIASLTPERKLFSSQDASSQYILNKKRQTVVSPSSFSAASSKKLRLDGRKNSPAVCPESPILQLHNFSEISISSPSPKPSPDLFDFPQSPPKFFSSSLPSALAPLSSSDADLVYEDDSMNIGASADSSTAHAKEITTPDHKESLNVDVLDGETNWNNSENHNESGWNYAVFDLDAEEKSKPPAWEFDENSSIKEIFNSHKDANLPRTQTCKASLASKSGINVKTKIKTEQGSCSTSEKPRVVHGIIYLSDSDDEGTNKPSSDAKTSKDKYELDKTCRKKRYWNPSPKFKGVDRHESAVPAQVCSDAEIEILPVPGESSKKTFKKPFHDKYRYGHLKHHKNNEFLYGAPGKKNGNYVSDSESDSLNSASVHALGRLQKSPRCQIYPQHSQVFSRSRDSALKNAHKSSSSVTDQEIDQRPNLEMHAGGMHCERGKAKNHSKKIPRPRVHFPPSEISALNASVLPDDKQESTSSNSKNVTSNIPHRSSDRVNHSSPQLHFPPHHHHHRHHRSYNRRGTHQEISRNRDSIRNRLHLDPIIFDSESNGDESSSEPPTNSQDLTNHHQHGELTSDNTHNIISSPDPVRQLQQLESDEMLARMLQAQFDAEVDIPEFQRSPRRSRHRSHPMPVLTGRRPTGRALRTHSTAFSSPSTPTGFLDVNAASYPLVFHNWDPSSSDDSDLDLLFPSMILNSPLADFLYGDLDWRDMGAPLRNERSRPPARGRSTRSWTRRNRALPNFIAGYEGNDYEALWELAEQIGEVTKRGLSWREINRLPTRIHSSPPEGFPASQCHICMCDYEEGDRLRILPCFHEFHAPCIDRWIKDNATCPVCRAKVNTERT